jgi:hypothetical protein
MPASPRQRVSLLTYASFLFGSRRAIETILVARGVFPLALLLTISAGFAREYDGEYLVAEPWYVLVPLVVALAMGTVLWLVLMAASRYFLPPDAAPGRVYAGFLTCYLLTAPMAWLYAVPYERWLSELDATRWNLWTLSAVSAWRVLLITRVAAILFRRSFWAMLAPVLLFASSAVVIALAASIRLPEFMAGVRMSDVEELVLKMTGSWFTLALLSWPVWAIGTTVAAMAKPEQLAPAADVSRDAKPAAAWIVAVIASVLVWGPLLPGPQSEQGLRYQVESRFARHEIAAALRQMSSHEQAEFPPHWRPPPLGFREFRSLTIVDVIEHFSETEPADWVREPYFESLSRILSAPRGALFVIAEEDWPRLVESLRRLPEGPAVACEAYGALKRWSTSDGFGDCVAELLDLAWQSGCPEALLNAAMGPGER